MIYSAGRYAVVQRSFAHVARQRTPISSHAHLYARYPAPFTLRLLSDLRTKPVSETKTPVPPPPHLPPKPKVALHPAPIPAQPQAHNPSSKPPPAPAKTVEASSLSHPPEKLALKDVTKTQIEDISNAEAHGVLAPAPADAGMVKKAVHRIWELLKFYLRGMKLVFTNRTRAQELRKRVASGGEPLTRRETRFLAQNDADVLKMIPFLFIVIIIEEIIPLLVIYAPWILPSTCVLPSQRERLENNRRTKQVVVAESIAPQLRHILAVDNSSLESSSQLSQLAGLLALSSFGLTSGAKRVVQHLKAIAKDDILLQSEENGGRLTQNELYEALEERGILTVGVDSQEARGRLQWWLREAGTGNDEDAVARRVKLVARSGLGEF